MGILGGLPPLKDWQVFLVLNFFLMIYSLKDVSKRPKKAQNNAKMTGPTKVQDYSKTGNCRTGTSLIKDSLYVRWQAKSQFSSGAHM